MIEFTIDFDHKENYQFIECHTCGKRSYFLIDIQKLYCGKCDKFHTTGKIRDMKIVKQKEKDV